MDVFLPEILGEIASARPHRHYTARLIALVCHKWRSAVLTHVPAKPPRWNYWMGAYCDVSSYFIRIIGSPALPPPGTPEHQWKETPAWCRIWDIAAGAGCYDHWPNANALCALTRSLLTAHTIGHAMRGNHPALVQHLMSTNETRADGEIMPQAGTALSWCMSRGRYHAIVMIKRLFSMDHWHRRWAVAAFRGAFRSASLPVVLHCRSIFPECDWNALHDAPLYTMHESVWRPRADPTAILQWLVTEAGIRNTDAVLNELFEVVTAYDISHPYQFHVLEWFEKSGNLKRIQHTRFDLCIGFPTDDFPGEPRWTLVTWLVQHGLQPSLVCLIRLAHGSWKMDPVAIRQNLDRLSTIPGITFPSYRRGGSGVTLLLPWYLDHGYVPETADLADAMERADRPTIRVLRAHGVDWPGVIGRHQGGPDFVRWLLTETDFPQSRLLEL